jgi:hypothetical protein
MKGDIEIQVVDRFLDTSQRLAYERVKLSSEASL